MKASSPVIDWQNLRATLNSLTLRKATIYLCASAGFYFVLQVFFMHENFLFAACISFGVCIGVWITAALLASVLALPGWLIRGEYQFRLNMIGMLVGTMAGAMTDPCRLMALSDSGKIIAIPLLAGLGFLATVGFIFPFFSSLTPERWSGKLGAISMTIGCIAAIGALSPIRQTSNDRGRQLFAVKRSAPIRMLSGRTVNLEVFDHELSDFASRSEAERKSSMEVAIFDAAPDLEVSSRERFPAEVAAPDCKAFDSTAQPATPMPAVIRFLNEGKSVVNVQWISDKGVAHPFRTLAAGESLSQASFFGQRWIVLGPVQECLGTSVISQAQVELKVSAH